MKFASRTGFVLTGVFLSASLLGGQGKADLDLDAVTRGPLCERRKAVIAIHRTGKAAIPELIGRIKDRAKTGASELRQNPKSSMIPSDHREADYAGLFYAYLIELILGRSSLETEVPPCDFLLGLDDYVFWSGIIRKEGDAMISADDLPRIQSVYSRWWKVNEGKTLSQMREEWQGNKRPLAGSQFRWR